MDVSDSSNYVGVPMACGYIHKRRWRHGSLLHSVIYAICSGAYAGKNIKKFWILPIITALFFLLGTWLFFSMGEKAFILYALGYLLLGIVAELISMFVKKKILRG